MGLYELWKRRNASVSEKRIANAEFALKTSDTVTTRPADSGDGIGRNLLTVLNVTTIPLAMAELRRRCNNNGEIDNTGAPDFSGIEIGDYIDGLNLSGIAAPTGGTAPAAWNASTLNNRIVVSGFNTYKGSGSSENSKNHILFTFRNIIAQGRMNATSTNTGGYRASELRIWLEGANGDGSGTFATGLKTALGGSTNYLYTISKRHSRKGSGGWDNYTVFLPTEVEVYGHQIYGDELTAGYGLNVHFPIFSRSTAFIVKKSGTSRGWWWLHTPVAADANDFCSVNYSGLAGSGDANDHGGVAPAFCVA
jgi:hypothetical protein